MYDVKKRAAYELDGGELFRQEALSRSFPGVGVDVGEEIRKRYKIRPGWSPGLVEGLSGSVGVVEERYVEDRQVVTAAETWGPVFTPGELETGKAKDRYGIDLPLDSFPEQFAQGGKYESETEIVDGHYERRFLDIENPVLYVKRYGHGLYKVVKMLDPATGPGEAGTWTNETDESGRFLNNIIRAKNTVEEYGLCNDFNLFATFTINGEKLDRTDLETFRKRLAYMVRNNRSRRGVDIQYLLVPELHADMNSWHIHGLMQMPVELLEQYKYDKHLPRKIKDKLIAGKNLYCWKSAESAYGWNTLERIENQEKSTRYLLKYFQKENRETAVKLKKGQHLYFASRGLKKAEKIPAEQWANIVKRAAPQYKRFGEWNIVEWWKVTESTDEEIVSEGSASVK